MVIDELDKAEQDQDEKFLSSHASSPEPFHKHKLSIYIPGMTVNYSRPVVCPGQRNSLLRLRLLCSGRKERLAGYIHGSLSRHGLHNAHFYQRFAVCVEIYLFLSLISRISK